MVKEKFNIVGMTCASCSSHVEKAVNKLDGVDNVNVNLLLNNMVVQYDEKVLDDSTIISAVRKAGYDAYIYNNENKEEKNYKKGGNYLNNDKEISDMKKRLIISICFLIPLMYLSMFHMLYEHLNIPTFRIILDLFYGRENSVISSLAQFLLLLPIIYQNRNYFINGLKMLFKRTPNMDSLIAIGSLSATIYSIFSMFMISYGLGHGNIELVDRYYKSIYFESAGTILTLITLGKYLETKSKAKTSDAISKLINLAPSRAVVIKDDKEVEIESSQIQKDDIVVIKPGSSIPVDGVVVYGSSYVDESSITGESTLVKKDIDDNVISATINKNGYLRIKAIKVGEDTTLSQIIKLVEEASNSKAPISKLADKVSGIFVPLVILIAIFVFIFWIIYIKSFEFALNMAISVLVISCPCALGLATPVAIMVGVSKAARNNILIKSAQSLELLHKVDTVVLDKTGTITNAKLKVTDIIEFVKDSNLLVIAASLESNSEHPLATSIIEKLKSEGKEKLIVKDFVSVSGRGIKGNIDNKEYYGGNISFMKENNIDITNVDKNAKVEALLKQGKTVLYFADKKQVLGVIAVADTIKETSYEAICELKKRNIDVVMITGDNKIVAKSIADELEIKNVVAECLPQDKQKEILKLQNEGKKVAFIGDGINDSPALIQADVGLAIGAGTDIAIESADIVLIRNSIKDAIYAIDLSRAVIKNIKENLFWAFFYNIISIPIASGVFYFSLGLKLSPMIGALAMSFSSVFVVCNALRLNKFKSKFKGGNNIMEKIEKKIYIDGMQCSHCKMSVENALKAIDGVKEVNVSLEDKCAVIILDKKIDDNLIKDAITQAGYVVVDIK